MLTLHVNHWQQYYHWTLIVLIFVIWSYGSLSYQSEYCLYFKHIISIINSDKNLKNTFWEIRSNKNFWNPEISIFFFVLFFRHFLALLSNWWWILYFPLLWKLSESVSSLFRVVAVVPSPQKIQFQKISLQLKLKAQKRDHVII